MTGHGVLGTALTHRKCQSVFEELQPCFPSPGGMAPGHRSMANSGGEGPCSGSAGGANFDGPIVGTAAAAPG